MTLVGPFTNTVVDSCCLRYGGPSSTVSGRAGMTNKIFRSIRALALPLLVAALSACGGGGGGGGNQNGGTPPPAAVPLSDAEAAKFLTQATFGPTDADISAVQAAGYRAWIDQQIAAPTMSNQAYVDNRLTQLRLTTPTATLSANHVYESFWLYAATSQSQLRERMKLALSEIFVISMVDANVDPRGAASYYDMLGANAFGNFRTLLEQVTLHPMMGVYLTHLANQKEDAATGRNPDENYAREVMQLMTLGVNKLNPDGSIVLDGSGVPTPSYTPADISGLARVFTGMSWYSPTPTANTFFGRNKDPDATVKPMIFYPAYHSTSAKTFLGTTIAGGSTDGAAEVKTALDVIFNNPNVGPFISKQLIQRLVTSNPSPAYVQRVATVFNDNGSGVRGDMAAVVRAILLDAEARDASAAASANYGKVREPVVRLANWIRAFGATSTSGNWLITSTSANTSLGQSVLTSPSVFNFFRPGYIPPNTRLGAASLTAPEFQIVDEVSVAGYANTMQSAIGNGIGTGADVKSTYASEVAIAGDAAALVERMNKLLLAGQMSAALKVQITDSVNGIAIPGGTATQAQIDAAKLNRAKLAVYLTMISPQYLVQR